MKRRDLLRHAVSMVVAGALPYAQVADSRSDIANQLARLERRDGGRLGVAALDTSSKRLSGHRMDERFLMCSTFKLVLVGTVLARVDHGLERLDQRVPIHKRDVLSYAPVTRQHVGAAGMSVAALCEAAITLSDNTAANLLLSRVGGPHRLTAFVRALGDRKTRFDRIEPMLNMSAPGDTRDTTTPAAMLGIMHALVLGKALSVPSRQRLQQWMRACRTGGSLLRAGFPETWSAGDKSGSGFHGEVNDVAVAWPPGRAPILVAAYYAPRHPNESTGHHVLAATGRITALI
jgi:beta-lactamase class A